MSSCNKKEEELKRICKKKEGIIAADAQRYRRKGTTQIYLTEIVLFMTIVIIEGKEARSAEMSTASLIGNIDAKTSIEGGWNEVEKKVSKKEYEKKSMGEEDVVEERIEEIIDKNKAEKYRKEKEEEKNAKMSMVSSSAGKSGVSPQSLALPNGAGTMQGMGESFSPNLNTGTVAFSVPVVTPPGRRGLKPNVDLSYTSGSGDGPLGWGWQIGIPSISRQKNKGIPRYGKSERFVFNGGQELVPIDMPEDEMWPSDEWNPNISGKSIVYFRAKIEGTFNRFFYNKDSDKWLVQDRQGNHYYYGETGDEKIDGPKGTYLWAISRTADIRNALRKGGNDIHYVYKRDGRNLYVENIFWNSYGQEYGNLELYQHQIHFVYEERPDRSVSFTAGFAIEQNLRLKRIEIRSYTYSPEGVRPLVRAYLITYQSEISSIHSKIENIQTCGKDWAENGSGTCMPPLNMQYSKISGLSSDGITPTTSIEGFGYFNEMVKKFTVSPDVSPEDPNVDIMDVNNDGLPDILITKPEYFGSDHAAIINDGLDGMNPEEAIRIDNPSGWSLELENMNVAVMDIDGAGNADMLHMPYGSKYHFYRLKGDEKEGLKWVKSPDIDVNKNIDFTQDSMDIRLVDINNDRLIDIVRTTGTKMEHYVNLSAFNEYEGQFGTFDENGQPIPNKSIDSCVLMRGGMMQFHDGNLRFGDMNGDGLQDIVDLKRGNIAYWPNRGYGQWGNTDRECSEGEYIDQLEIEMKNSPWFNNPEYQGVSIADLNGDGLSDLVQIRFESVDIWFNKGNDSFSDRYTIEGTPPTDSSFYGKVRFADINGSGTVDIVWADAGGYQYLDLAGYYRDMTGNGGMPAGMLERVKNGVGGETYIQYAPSTELMINARLEGDPWSTNTPMPLVVVKKVTSTNHMEKVGGKEGRYTTEYIYKNPFYDGHESEFKGFGVAEVWDREIDADQDGIMDPELCSRESIAKGEAPIVTRTIHHRGIRPECMDPPIEENWGPDSKACWDKQHKDNPLAGLAGTAISSEVYSPCTGKVITATISEVEVRKLFESNNTYDGRSIYTVFPNKGRVYKYNPNDQEGSFTEKYPWITLNDESTIVLEKTYVTAAPLGKFHRITSETEFNNSGFPTKTHHDGFFKYNNEPLYRFAGCDDYTEYYSVERDPSTWVHKAVHSHKAGPIGQGCSTSCTSEPGSQCSVMDKEYNKFGEIVSSSVTYRDFDGTENVVEISRKSYNNFGQLTHEYGVCDGNSCKRHTKNVYTSEEDGDLYYSAFIREEVNYVPDAAIKQFSFKARWDVTAMQVNELVGPDGASQAVEYDALGRFKRLFGTHPETGDLCPEPIKETYYHYGTESSPMSMMETWVNTSKENCGSDRWEVVYSWIDSRGQPYSTVAPGDEYLGSESVFPWMMAGQVDLNAKGTAVGDCEALPIDSPPRSAEDLFSMQRSSQEKMAEQMPGGKWNCTRKEFDAFGRPTYTYTPSTHEDAVNGYVMTYSDYGIDEAFAYDHNDLTDVDHLGTYTSQRIDGLERTVEKVTRHRAAEGLGDGEVVERKVTISFGGSPGMGGGWKVITKDDVRPGEEKSTPISRKAIYDSLGRVRKNIDPNFGVWTYAYDDLGQLIGSESPTGDVASFTYDMAGRLTEEAYNGRVEAQYFYDIYPGDDVLGLADNLEWEGFPDYANTIGRLVAVKDTTGVSISAANLGTRSETWKQLNPSDRIYHFETLTDWAGELIWSKDPDGDELTIDYYHNGILKSNYWNGKKIIDEVRANMHGQIETVKYADAADTVSWTGYNPVTHQAINTVVQQQNRVYEPRGTGSQVTLLAFGYQYDVIGLLDGISDWRGRSAGDAPRLGLQTQHPTTHDQDYIGYHQSSFPRAFDESLAGPTQWNSSDVVSGSVTGWPVGAAPSDALFGYDSLYQLVSEDREYITANGVDSQLDEDYGIIQERVTSLDWNFDSTGSMTEWLDGEDSSGNVSTKSFGRALGRIQNGYQLNVKNSQAGCMNALFDSDEVPETCYKPEAIYFATNVDDVMNPSEPADHGRGTCIWAEYDKGGRMVRQVVRAGCRECEYADLNDPTIDWGEQCPGAPEVGTPGASGYKRAVEAKLTEFTYYWNGAGQLEGAARTVNSSETIAMAYYYDASGARVIRQKGDVVSGDLTNIRQDLYISGGYERRQVQLIDLNSGDPESVSFDGFLNQTTIGQYDELDGSRLVKHVSGVRIDVEWEGETPGEEKWFLKFGNHLGSTTVVTDFDTGALVEWSTQYAYGSDESHWRNLHEKYTDSEGKFSSSEPYGFTGKEEDIEVGLHYFGARYYSAYLGRWLSPDPPVVHKGGDTNLYNYGANSPYIYVDPDGNWIHILVAAIIGSVVGTVQEVIKRGGIHSVEDVFWSVVAGIRGGGIGAASAANPMLGAAAATSDTQLQMLMDGTDPASLDFHKQSAITLGTSAVSGYAGQGIGSVAKGISGEVASELFRASASYAVSTSTAMVNQALWTDEGLTSDNYDDVLRQSSVSFVISYGASLTGNAAVRAGMESGTQGGMTSSDEVMGERNQATQNTPGQTHRYKNISGDELPGGPVILHVENREVRLDNMQAAFRWMERNSNLGGGQWLDTENGRIWVHNRREVDVIFYRQVSTDPNNRVSMRTIHGDVAFGRPYEPGVSGHSPRQLIDNPNTRVIGITHTHPWGKGEWAIDFAANDVVEMDYGPSVGDYNSDRAVDNYAGYNVRAWVIQNGNIMEY